MKISLDQIKFENDLYPRSKFDNETVKTYRLNIEALPPIILQKNELILIDGYHRFLAHQQEGINEIEVELIDIPKEKILWEAIRLNSTHGLQLNRLEKKTFARKFYTDKIEIKEIMSVLSISESTIYEWIKDIIKKENDERNDKIFDMWLAGKTYPEISEKIKLTEGRVSQIISEFKNSIIGKIKDSSWYDHFSIQTFNVWSFQGLDPRYGLNGTKGQIPGQIIENLLYYFTEPFDIVADPMVGGGTTIDVCKAMYRRYYASDIEIKRLDLEISQWDIRNGFPSYIFKPNLIFLDPPYYNIMEKGFFETLEDFYDFIDELVTNSYDAIQEKGIVALLMCDNTKEEFEYLRGKCYNRFYKKFGDPVSVISCPLTTQSANAGEINKSKENRQLLGRDRTLFVYRRKN